MLALGCHETAPDIDSAGIGKRMFCVIRSSLLLAAFAQAVKANVLFFTMFVKNFFVQKFTRAPGVAAEGERGVISRPVK